MRLLVITQKVDNNDSILGFFCNWLNELAKKIDKIYVIVLEKRNTNLAKNIELYSLGKERGNGRIKRFIKFNQLVARVLFRREIDVVFIHMCPEYVLSIFPYARITRVPIVMWYAHGSANLKLKIAHLLVDQVITSSRSGFRLKSKKVAITGQGIDTEKFKPQTSNLKPQNEKSIILSIGRISPIKNYETLIKAADILINQRNIKDLEFQIIGGIPLKSRKRYLDFLKNTVREYNLENYIQFIGSISYTQVQNYYRDCDLFISTSNTGSLDKTVLEAMACGKIVLTCNEAFRDVLDSHSENLMFEKENFIELAEKINSMIQTDEKPQKDLWPDLRNIVIENHNLNLFIDKLVKIFKEIVGG